MSGSQDRRAGWASIEDPVLRDRIYSHLQQAPEWETRLAAMERHFDNLIARLDGMATVWRYSLGIIVGIIAAFAGALTWYANERNSDLNHLSAATNRLAIIAEVLTAKQERDELDKSDLRSRLDEIERRERAK